MAKISVCLATFNEEKNIKDCLDSVKWADEIVVVDGTSKDRTVEIAKKYTSKIIIRENPVMFHINKQKAFEAAMGDWILYLDADERITPELEEEIKSVIRPPTGDAGNTQYDGYWISRKNIIFGKWIKNSFWSPDYQLRFFKKGKAFLPCKSVHEQPKLLGKAGYLKQPLIHYNYQSVSQYIQKLNNFYTENDKRAFLSQKKEVFWYDAIRFPVNEFMATFFARKAYKDGLHGLVLSLLQSFSAFVTFAKIWEVRGFPEAKTENFLGNTEKEIQRAQSEFKYWFLSAKINQTTSFWKKLCYRILRKTS